LKALVFDADGLPAGVRRRREAEHLVSRGWARWSTLRAVATRVQMLTEQVPPDVQEAVAQMAAALEADADAAGNLPVLILADRRPSDELRRRRLERAVARSRMRDLAGWAPQETDAVRRFRLGAPVGDHEWPDVQRAARDGRRELARVQTARQIAARR